MTESITIGTQQLSAQMAMPQTEGLLFSLNSFFNQLSDFCFQGRRMNCIHLDIKEQKLKIDFESIDDEVLESYESYFTHFEKRLANDIRKIEEGYHLWKDRHLSEPTIDDYQERLSDELKRLLDDTFLIEETGLINDKKLIASRDELQQWSLDNKERNIRYAILKEMVPIKNNRFCFDNREAIGHYLKNHYKHLTEETVKGFFRFKTVSMLIYADIDRCQKAVLGRMLTHGEEQILNRLIKLIRKGDWKGAATAENIEQMILAVLNVDKCPLCQEESRRSDVLWQLLTTGRGDRVRIIWQNMIGYFAENGLLPAQQGSPALCKMFFDDDENYSNIDKGKPSSKDMSTGFKEILPLLNAHLPQ